MSLSSVSMFVRVLCTPVLFRTHTSTVCEAPKPRHSIERVSNRLRRPALRLLRRVVDVTSPTEGQNVIHLPKK